MGWHMRSTITGSEFILGRYGEELADKQVCIKLVSIGNWILSLSLFPLNYPKTLNFRNIF